MRADGDSRYDVLDICYVGEEQNHPISRARCACNTPYILIARATKGGGGFRVCVCDTRSPQLSRSFAGLPTHEKRCVHCSWGVLAWP